MSSMPGKNFLIPSSNESRWQPDSRITYENGALRICVGGNAGVHYLRLTLLGLRMWCWRSPSVTGPEIAFQATWNRAPGGLRHTR